MSGLGDPIGQINNQTPLGTILSWNYVPAQFHGIAVGTDCALIRSLGKMIVVPVSELEPGPQ